MINSQSDLWRQLRHPQVRDLAWCLLSADIMQPGAACAGYTLDTAERDICARLRYLDEQPQALEAFLMRAPSQRLGLIFERYWQFWWQAYASGDDEWLFNLQLHEAGRTVGEVDALRWAPLTGELLHTELAVKFYLGISNTENTGLIPGWYGPEVRDRLDLKWHHLMEQQLSPQPLRSAILPDHWHQQQLRSALLTRGRLFYPLLNRDFHSPNQPLLAPAHDRGYWLHCRDLERLPAGCWQVIERRHWFAPLRQPASSSFPHRQLCDSLRERLQGAHSRPVQIVRLQEDNGECFEVERYFVVPDQWPGSPLHQDTPADKR